MIQKAEDGYVLDEDGIDLVVTFGGDSTMMFVSTSSQNVVPPVMAISPRDRMMHSSHVRGFLTPFSFAADFGKRVKKVRKSKIGLGVRVRVRVRVRGLEG